MQESIEQQGFPIYFSGDKKLLEYVNLKIDTTIMLQKPYLLSIPLVIAEQQLSILEPIVSIEILSQIQRQNLFKNPKLIKENVHYIYFPASIRVDEMIYKIYLNSYQNLLKQAPRSCRGNFSKLIIYEEGKSQHSIASQKNKINQTMSNIVKVQIEKRIDSINSQIREIQDHQPTAKDLLDIFKLKNKLSIIYNLLRINSTSIELLQTLWKQFLNDRIILCPYSQVKFKCPFIQQNIHIIVTLFDKPEQYLKIINFTFIELFKNLLKSMLTIEAIQKLKYFIDFVTKNILKKSSSPQIQVRRHLWVIEIIDQCNSIRQNGNYIQSIINKQNQYQQILINLATTYRKSTEKIGTILYGFNIYKISPTTFSQEIELVLLTLSNKIDNSYQKQLTLRINVQELVSDQMLSQTVSQLIDGFQSYKKVYIKSLQKMHKVLENSLYNRIGECLKISIMKAYILYLYDSQQMKSTKIDKILESKFVWKQLRNLLILYKIAFQKVRNKKQNMKQCLVSLLNQKSIYKLENQWKNLLLLAKNQTNSFNKSNNQSFLLCKFSYAQFKQICLYKYKINIKLLLSELQRFPIDEAFVEIKQSNQTQRLLKIQNVKINGEKFQCQLNTKELLQFKIISIKIISNEIPFSIQNQKLSNNFQIINNAKIKIIENKTKNIQIYQYLWNPVDVVLLVNGSQQILSFNILSDLIISDKVKINNKKQISTSQLLNFKFQQNVIENKFYIQFYFKKNNNVQKNLSQQNKIQVSFKIKHQKEQYQIKDNINYLMKQSFKMDYYYVEQLQEYSIKNITNLQLIVSQQQNEWTLEQQQQLKIDKSLLIIKFKQCEQIILNLQDFIQNKQYLKPKNIQFFDIEIENINKSVGIFDKIGIKSMEIGKLKIKDSYNQGYQLIGKIEGNVSYVRQDYGINLWLVPKKRGKIILPEIWINKKKGIWKNQFYIQVL